MMDLLKSNQDTKRTMDLTKSQSLTQRFTLKSKDGLELREFERQEDITFLFLVLINVCHECFSKSKNISEELSFSTLKDAIDYEGPSPDEIALLRGS